MCPSLCESGSYPNAPIPSMGNTLTRPHSQTKHETQAAGTQGTAAATIYEYVLRMQQWRCCALPRILILPALSIPPTRFRTRGIIRQKTTRSLDATLSEDNTHPSQSPEQERERG